MLQIVVPLMIVNYDRSMFIVQATDSSVTKKKKDLM